MGPARKGRPHSSTLSTSPMPVTGTAPPIPISAAARPARLRTKPMGDGRAPNPEADARPARPGCGARGRWRGLDPTTQPQSLHSRLLAPSRSRLCSGRRMACPPARRPSRELRSARRLEARPGPAGPAAPYTRPTPAQYGVVVLPCLPCSAPVYITRPRPVSRPRPRQ